MTTGTEAGRQTSPRQLLDAVVELAAAVTHHQRELREAQADLQTLVQEAVAAGVLIKDIAAAAELTPQRVSQINAGKR